MLIPKRSRGMNATLINGKQASNINENDQAESFDMHMKNLRKQIK